MVYRDARARAPCSRRAAGWWRRPRAARRAPGCAPRCARAPPPAPRPTCTPTARLVNQRRATLTRSHHPAIVFSIGAKRRCSQSFVVLKNYDVLAVPTGVDLSSAKLIWPSSLLKFPYLSAELSYLFLHKNENIKMHLKNPKHGIKISRVLYKTLYLSKYHWYF